MKLIKFNCWLLGIICITSGSVLAAPSFEEAKKELRVIYKLHPHQEFYCGCDFSSTNVDLASCGYKIRRNKQRAKRIEWEHVMPASYLVLALNVGKMAGVKNVKIPNCFR